MINVSNFWFSFILSHRKNHDASQLSNKLDINSERRLDIKSESRFYNSNLPSQVKKKSRFLEIEKKKCLKLGGFNYISFILAKI